MSEENFVFTAPREKRAIDSQVKSGVSGLKVALFSGGTGGHLTPGIALVQALRKKVPHVEALFFTARRHGELAFSRQLPGPELDGFSTSVRGKSVFFGVHLFQKIVRIKRLLSARHVQTCVGLGGFSSLPGVLAALLCGIPVVLLEQNRVIGRANRILSPLATQICLSFPDSFPKPPRLKARYTGNPVRRSFIERRQPRWHNFLKRPLEIAVLGGSQGALAINRVLIRAAPEVARLKLPVRLIHSAGASWGEVKQTYERFSVASTVAPFFKDLAERIGGCAFAFSRAGGCSIAELLVLGIPAVFVPYPYARDGHQEANALYVQEHGAGYCFKQESFTSERVLQILVELCTDPGRWKGVCERAYRLGRPEAAERVAEVVLNAKSGGRK